MKPRQPVVRKARFTSGTDLDPEQEPRGLLSARSLGVGACLVGPPAGIGMFHPALGAIIVGIELMVTLTIISTALFGSQALSERAFRLLRWLGNRPEPPSPPPSHPGGTGQLPAPAAPPPAPSSACDHVLGPDSHLGAFQADWPAHKKALRQT
jgi:hypothetical protein